MKIEELIEEKLKYDRLIHKSKCVIFKLNKEADLKLNDTYQGIDTLRRIQRHVERMNTIFHPFYKHLNESLYTKKNEILTKLTDRIAIIRERLARDTKIFNIIVEELASRKKLHTGYFIIENGTKQELLEQFNIINYSIS